MKVEVKKVNEIKRELKFEVSKDRISKGLDEVYKELGKVAKVKGFRPGKVPRKVLEVHHGKLAQEELLRKVVPDAYQEAIEKENLFPIDVPEIHDVNLKDGVLTFKAQLEIKPEVKIKEYKGIKVKRKSSKVTEEEINKTLDFFKQGQGEGNDVVIDDKFAHGLGYPSLEEFKKSLSRQLEIDKDRHNRVDVENQIIEALLKRGKLIAPDSLVNKQMGRRLSEQAEQMKKQGLKKEDVDKKIEESKSGLREAVEKDVKVYLILDKIAEEEKLGVKEGENLPAKVIEFLLKEAQWEEEK